MISRKQLREKYGKIGKWSVKLTQEFETDLKDYISQTYSLDTKETQEIMDRIPIYNTEIFPKLLRVINRLALQIKNRPIPYKYEDEKSTSVLKSLINLLKKKEKEDSKCEHV